MYPFTINFIRFFLSQAPRYFMRRRSWAIIICSQQRTKPQQMRAAVAHVHSWATQESHVWPKRPSPYDAIPLESVLVNSHGTAQGTGEAQESQEREGAFPTPSWNWSVLRQRRRREEEEEEGSEARGWRSRARSRARRRRATSRPASPRTCSTPGSTHPFLFPKPRTLRLLRRSMYSW
jgi:hypothetical protein